MLAMLWASQANSLPATAWAVMLLGLTPPALAAVRAEVPPTGLVAAEVVTGMAYTRAAVQEAVRLYSPGVVVRQAIKDTPVGDYVV